MSAEPPSDDSQQTPAPLLDDITKANTPSLRPVTVLTILFVASTVCGTAFFPLAESVNNWNHLPLIELLAFACIFGSMFGSMFIWSTMYVVLWLYLQNLVMRVALPFLSVFLSWNICYVSVVYTGYGLSLHRRNYLDACHMCIIVLMAGMLPPLMFRWWLNWRLVTAESPYVNRGMRVSELMSVTLVVAVLMAALRLTANPNSRLGVSISSLAIAFVLAGSASLPPLLLIRDWLSTPDKRTRLYSSSLVLITSVTPWMLAILIEPTPRMLVPAVIPLVIGISVTLIVVSIAVVKLLRAGGFRCTNQTY